MKKLTTTFILVILVFCLISCSHDQAPQSTEIPSKNLESTQESSRNDTNTEAQNEAQTTQPTDASASNSEPTTTPLDLSTIAPTDVPTDAPTDVPTDAPTDVPIDAPTDAPTDVPTDEPTEAPTDAPTDVPIDEPTEAPTDEPAEEVSLPFFWFKSIQDLHTFATTLSTDPENYKTRPFYDFKTLEDYFEPEEFADYQPIDQYFDIDEEEFDSVEAGFGIGDNGNMEYGFCLDDIFIWIYHVKSDSISECYIRKAEMESNDQRFQDYSSADHLQNGHLLKTTSDTEVIYYVKDGIKREIHFLIGNAYIRVYGAVFYGTDVAKIYEEILTNPKYSEFAPLFSDDEEIFNQAIKKIESVK